MNPLRAWLNRRREGRELAEEIAQHIEERADELASGGMPRAEAERQARREFGNVTLVEEKGRDVWAWPWIESTLADLAYALRQMRRAPSFTAACVLTLALGIGANTAVFSVVNAVLLRPLPYPEPERLVSVEAMNSANAKLDSYSYPNFFDIRQRAKAFERIVCSRNENYTLTGRGQAEHVTAQIVSWDFFEMLRTPPAMGRAFLPEEERRGVRVAVLSHKLWRERFGADPAVVGQSAVLDGIPYTVAGVAPAGLHFPPSGLQTDLWTTLAVDAASSTVRPMTAQRGLGLLTITARLAPGVSIAQAKAQVDGISAGLAAAYPEDNKMMAGAVIRRELDRMTGGTRRMLWTLLGAVAFVLLIACANIANLLAARTGEREREFSVRLAIGAGRGRLVRQLLTENLLMSSLGCGAGIALAVVAVRAGAPLAGDIPRIELAEVDANVLLFSVGAALLTAALCSLPSALRVGRGHIEGALRDGGRTSTGRQERMQGALVAAQVALGFVLLTGATSLAASFVRLTQRDAGIRTDHLLSFQVSLSDASYPRDKGVQGYMAILNAIRGVPGVEAVAGGSPLPLGAGNLNVSFTIEGRPVPKGEEPYEPLSIVTPGFFRLLGIGLIRGRDFTERDDPDAPGVLIVNQAFANKYFPGEDPIGRKVTPGASDHHGKRVREIVGVVTNAKRSVMHADAEPGYYVPFRQMFWFPPAAVVRTATAPEGLEPAVRSAVAAFDKDVPVHEVRTYGEIRSRGVAVPRFQTVLLSVFAGVALLLTAIGLYGLLAHSIVRRTREIGLRVALGASRGSVVEMILGRAFRLAAVGGILGLAGTWATEQLLRPVLPVEIPERGWLTAAACAVILVTVALAAWLPARRAARIEPMAALRVE